MQPLHGGALPEIALGAGLTAVAAVIALPNTATIVALPQHSLAIQPEPEPMSPILRLEALVISEVKSVDVRRRARAPSVDTTFLQFCFGNHSDADMKRRAAFRK